MNSWTGKLVLALALAVMPLQGIAATLSALLCHGEAQAHASHAGEGHDHSPASGGSHGQHPADDGAGSGAPYHLCCHFTVTAPATVTLSAALPDFPARVYTPDLPHDFFVPDRP